MNFLRRFMMGRYGSDQLNNLLLVLALALCLVQWLTRWQWLSVVVFALLILCYVRMFSRNIPARYAENQKFLRVWAPFSQRLRDARARFADRKTHCYFKCPQCKKRLRVPKGRGKIEIHCPGCGAHFVRKS